MKIFQDLDGCIVDFESKILEITGKKPYEQQARDMWRAAANYPDFFYTLDYMSDGKDLWDSIKHLEPTILTGLPFGKWASGQKMRWVGDNLGYHVPCITCMTSDKHTYASPGDVLIDDRLKTKDAWERAGGVFVLHISTINTVKILKELNILL